MVIYPGLLYMMRGEDYWDLPDAFMPERFLDNNMQIKQKKAWFPFSIGNRQVTWSTSPYEEKITTPQSLNLKQGMPITAVLDGYLGLAGSEARDRTGLVL